MDFLLIHGAWHGGWCWRKLLPSLIDQGHRVYTPTLSGVGERHHLFTEALGLETHVSDILNVRIFEDIKRCVVVGHSYAGMVMTGVAGILPHGIAHLVYLDAVVPASGESFCDCVPRWTTLSERILAVTDSQIPPPNYDHPFGITDPADIRWARSKFTPHPKKTLTDTLFFDESIIENIPKTYLHCIEGMPEQAFDDLPVHRIQRQANWTYHRLPVGHDAMITAPNLLADVLLKVANEIEGHE